MNIELITNAEVKSVEGRPGNFMATLANHPRYIDPAACTGCGDCARACPVSAVNEINKGLNDRRATHIEYAQAVPLAFAIDAQACVGCGLCEKMCLANAVRYDDKVKETKKTVGSVILAPGTKGFDPSGIEALGYGKYPNVVTSEGFERILSAGGPYFGHVMRPLDRQEPKSIAWLQCVGSRDSNQCGNGYCSSVCCMYAAKEAMIAKEHIHGDLDCAVFNMDMRTFGKDYEKYFLRARDKEGIRFVKARAHTITEISETGDLALRYANEAGDIVEEVFSMVVLSVGLTIPDSAVDLAKRLDVDMDRYHFAETDPFSPVETSRPGIYVCGVFQGPKDIPGSVTEAGAAACLAGADLSESRGADIDHVKQPEEIDIAGKDPRVGVFVCNCGINIGGIVDVPAVQEYASTLPGVVFADSNLFTCSQDTQEKIKEMIKTHDLNRVVVASCSPKTHEPMFMETLEACGLNRYLFEMANIRNQNSWIHSKQPEVSTAKAKDLVRMAVARAGTLKPLKEKVIQVIQKALVIGGGVAGMNSALSLARQGFEVVLTEKEPVLGGFARNLIHTIEGADIGAYIEKLSNEVSAHEKIKVLTGAHIKGFGGYKGNFETRLSIDGETDEKIVKHGVIIVATGAVEYQPSEYLYGQDKRVSTQVELSRMLEDGPWDDPECVVMIQCVGSRNDEMAECSRICCQAAVKNALKIKKKSPDTQVFVLYRDMRTYGLMEDFYKEAREKGVMFIRHDLDSLPEVSASDEGVLVRTRDHVLERDIEIRADLLALSAGVRAADTKELAGIMKLNANQEGYFIEAHVKLRPVDMPGEGIFLCGTAHGPKLISETISQAQAAAARATTFLARPEIKLSAITAHVDTDHCVRCLTCLRTCPFDVPAFNEEKKVIEIDEAICHGCGTCAGACPRQAIQLGFYEDEQIKCKIDALLSGGV
ncbi:Heterodisulfide reductase [Candidatus Desulfarcum epimagneticum]|uniref:Heterodisulfide reductase n=1 Tax=uncultured Desulfobacteraceae bacterium TaxID=218296 RepID=A0A484HLR4_9BACT|nr:Heterodisulfide reductase [uncultured Desulfobacteraceae bacterium]